MSKEFEIIRLKLCISSLQEKISILKTQIQRNDNSKYFRENVIIHQVIILLETLEEEYTEEIVKIKER